MIVAVVAEQTAAAVRQRLEELAQRLQGVEALVEVRLDAMENPDPGVGEGAGLPLVITCRRPREGGGFRGSEKERLQLLEAGLSRGARYVDLEMDVLDRCPWARGPHLVASHHDLEKTPPDLGSRVTTALASGAAMVKLATRVRRLGDLEILAGAGALARGRVVTIGLGPEGIASRLLFRRLHSPWIYALASNRGALPFPLPPGLPRLEEVAGLYYPDLALPEPLAAFGVLSDRALESIGPWVFNRLFRREGLPALYVPVQAPDLEGLRPAMELLGLVGLSVTTPFKEAVLSLADEVHPLAQAIGAANTLVLQEGRLRAFNTDFAGVSDPLVRALGSTHPGGEALVLGAGGAGRAAALALRELGFQVRLWSRSRPRAVAAASHLGVELDAGEGKPPRVLVNATPAGGPRDPEALPAAPDLVVPGQIVMEMNYGRRETPLVVLARARGARVITGEEVYISQAANQVHHFWRGLEGVREFLEEAVAWAVLARASS